jgi:Fibronectin type III domain
MRAQIPFLILGFGLFSNAFTTDCQAQVAVSLAWRPSTDPDVAGYHLAWGTNSGVYFATNTCPATQTSGTISNLAYGVTYYIAVSAFTGNGQTSPFSGEVTFTGSNPLQLAPIADCTNYEAMLLTITNSATDNNLPPRALTFSLGAGAPANATIDPITGVFQWRPTAVQAPGTNFITVIVTDNGTPPLSATRQFKVVVFSVGYEFLLGAGRASLFPGAASSVALTLTSQLSLTNLTAVFQASTNSLANLALAPVSPEVIAASLQPLGASRYGLSFALNPALSPGNTRTLAQLSFQAASTTHSAIVPLVVSQLSGLLTGDQPAAKPASVNGRVIIIGREPVLDAWLATNSRPMLTIYANPGSNCEVVFSTNLAFTNWQSAGNVLITNPQQDFDVNSTAPQIFYETR